MASTFSEDEEIVIRMSKISNPFLFLYGVYQGWNSQNACQNSKQRRLIILLLSNTPILVCSVCRCLFGRHLVFVIYITFRNLNLPTKYLDYEAKVHDVRTLWGHSWLNTGLLCCPLFYFWGIFANTVDPYKTTSYKTVSCWNCVQTNWNYLSIKQTI